MTAYDLLNFSIFLGEEMSLNFLFLTDGELDIIKAYRLDYEAHTEKLRATCILYLRDIETISF